jgi:hypothetical protein
MASTRSRNYSQYESAMDDFESARDGGEDDFQSVDGEEKSLAR